MENLEHASNNSGQQWMKYSACEGKCNDQHYYMSMKLRYNSLNQALTLLNIP